MRIKLAVLWFAVAVLIVMAGFPKEGLGDQLSACLPACSSVVDKMPSQAFYVEVAFKNTGTTEGSWFVNVAFEGEKWVWSGALQSLALKSGKTKTLSWNGSVPAEAPIDSVARLIVYYNDSFIALNWWIHVVSGAELAITSSTVR